MNHLQTLQIYVHDKVGETLGKTFIVSAIVKIYQNIHLLVVLKSTGI